LAALIPPSAPPDVGGQKVPLLTGHRRSTGSGCSRLLMPNPR